MTLPLLVSVPHAGLQVPEIAKPYCRLSHEEIVADGDEGAATVYRFAEQVAQFVTTDVARAIVDLNRAEDDFRQDGVIKTHTCWNVPVYDSFPPPDVVKRLLHDFYRPYHQILADPNAEVRLCVDCHTMAAVGPPVGPDIGRTRPSVCLGDAGGATMPKTWMLVLASCFERSFAGEIVTVNTPFSGGFITRHHGKSRPWVQLEVSRAPFMTDEKKEHCVMRALTDFCQKVF